MLLKPEIKRLGNAQRIIKRLKEADVLLISEKGLLHSLNRMLQRSKWHHVMLYIGNGMTLEVTPKKGAHICDLMYDLTEKQYIAYKILRNNEFSSRQRKRITGMAINLFLGKKFSWSQYAKIIIGRLMELWKEEGNKSIACKPGHRPNVKNVACSNMVAMAYYEAGFPVSEKYMPEYVVPKDYEGSKEFSMAFKGELKQGSR